MLKEMVRGWAHMSDLPLRVVVGTAFIGHGWPKLLNLSGTVQSFGQLGIPLPGLFGPLVMALEVFGGAALTLGLFTRWVALGYVIEMVVTTFYVKLPAGRPFIGGYEIDLLFLAAGLVFLLAGPGPFSLDRRLRLDT